MLLSLGSLAFKPLLMTIPRCLELLAAIWSLSLKIASSDVLPCLFRSPQRSLIWAFTSCLITSVPESLPGNSSFSCNANINPLQHPLIRTFFPTLARQGYSQNHMEGIQAFLSCFPAPICTSYLKKWCYGIIPLVVIPSALGLFDLWFFVMGLTLLGV